MPLQGEKNEDWASVYVWQQKIVGIRTLSLNGFTMPSAIIDNDTPSPALGGRNRSNLASLMSGDARTSSGPNQIWQNAIQDRHAA